MNCKQGDLAVVVGGENNVGRIVQTLVFDPHRHHTPSGIVGAWHVSGLGRNLSTVSGHLLPEVWFPDGWLKPIRPDEGEDETLLWAGKPEKVAA